MCKTYLTDIQKDKLASIAISKNLKKVVKFANKAN